MPSCGPVKQQINYFVIDTNILVSALIFGGIGEQILKRLQAGTWKLIVDKPILQEYFKVFAYPKFKLDKETVQALMEEYILPFCEFIQTKTNVPVCRDPEDDKFLFCAVSADSIDAIISGDQDLLSLVSYQGIPIMTLREALVQF